MSTSDYEQGLAVALKAIGEWLNGFKWKQCPDPCDQCKHGHKMERHLGPPEPLGYRQFSCPCRLARQGGQSVSCGCEWTFDEPPKVNLPFGL